MFNKVIFAGNLTKDIEIRYTPSTNTPIGRGSIASSRRYKTRDGTQKEEVCYLDFTMFGRTAEVANQYLRKGSQVLLEGSLVLEKWVGTDGQNRSKHSLKVDQMKMLGSKTEGFSSQTQESVKKPENKIPEVVNMIDEEEPPF